MAVIVNTFVGMQMSFPNGGIHSVIGTAFKFRKQLTLRPEFQQQSGWNNQMNIFLQQGLLEISDNLKRVTYNPETVATQTGPSSTVGTGSAQNAANGPTTVDLPPGGAADGNTTTLETIEQQAADTTKSLKDMFNANSPNTDNLLMPAQPDRPVIHDVSGANPDIPLIDPAKYQNDHGRLFISGLDNFITQMTRLDSRFDPQYVTKYESAMMLAQLTTMWTITEVFGGEENRTNTPTGTLPSQETGTVKAATA